MEVLQVRVFAAAPAPAGGGMMELGSKAGYYTSKSPKMLLAEWAQKEKMQRPRFSSRSQEGGVFTCKARALLHACV